MWDVTPCRVGEWASDTVGLASSGPLHSYYFFRRIRRLALVCVCVCMCVGVSSAASTHFLK